MRLHWPGCVNVRDLGELPTTDGGRTRAGALIRADSLRFLSEAGVAAVRAAGIARIVDLRAGDELTRYPTPFSTDPIAVHVPVQDPGDPPDDDRGTIVAACVRMLDRHPELFAAAVRAIVSAPEGPVVVHCHGGKDRTGLVVALVLSAVGVPRDAVVADYFLTQANLAPRLAEQLAAEPDGTRHAALVEFRDTRAETMEAILDHLDRRYGGAEQYLRRGGLTPGQLAALRARLIRRPGPRG